jgi:hypothetical protein
MDPMEAIRVSMAMALRVPIMISMVKIGMIPPQMTTTLSLMVNSRNMTATHPRVDESITGSTSRTEMVVRARIAREVVILVTIDH